MKTESGGTTHARQHDAANFISTNYSDYNTYREIDGVHVQFDIFGLVTKLTLAADQDSSIQSYGVIRWRSNVRMITALWTQTSHAISLIFKGPDAEEHAQDAYEVCRRHWTPISRCKVKLHSTGEKEEDEVNAIVELMSLPRWVTVKAIEESLPESIKSATLVTYSDVTGVKAMTKELRRFGELEKKSMVPHSCRPSSRLSAAFAQYKCPAEAVKVSKLKGGKCAMGSTTRDVTVLYDPYIEFWVPTKLLNAVKIQLNVLITSTWVVHCPDITFESDFKTTTDDTGFIKVKGKNLKSLRRVQAELMALFEGEVVEWYGEPLWNEAISEPSALFILDKLSRENNVYLLRDTTNCVIKMYGGCPSDRIDVKQYLVGRLGYPHQVYAIDDSDEACAVCTSPAEKFIKVYCGHIYCLACFVHLVNSCGGQLPLHCCGQTPYFDGTTKDCLHLLTLEEIAIAVPRSVLDQLLINSFKKYLEINFAKYRNCPTRDCVSIYRHTEEQAITTCDRCFESTCSACGLEAHTGKTCEVHEEQRDGGAALMKKWMTEQKDMKRCPSCTVPMWKSFGCDHMQCRCGEHFCWICLAKFGKNSRRGEFNSGQKVYQHLEKVHKSIGGGYVMRGGIYVLRDENEEEEMAAIPRRPRIRVNLPRPQAVYEQEENGGPPAPDLVGR